jgi:CRISPR-associated endonuclease/helicase Cas3
MGQILSFWAKSGSDSSYHPVAYHLLDVAACAEAILDAETRRVRWLAKRLAVPPDVLSRALVALIGLHDIGKISRSFQAKRPGLWPPCLGPLDSPPPDRPHDDLGFLLLVCS